MKTNHLTFVPFMLILAILLPACAPRSTVKAGDLASLTMALDVDMPGLLAAYRVEGASIALVVDGQVVWSKGYGWQDKAAGMAASSQTVYQIASISKTVTAWGVMRLVEAGKLDLDASAGRYLTRWNLPPAVAEDGSTLYDPGGVTIRRLLSHSAGLSVHGYPGYAPEMVLPSLEESLSGRQGPGYAVRLVNAPGTAFNYSGGGYTLLQLIIEEVSGQHFADFMQAEVLGPLGMKQTSFTWRDDLRVMTAQAYHSSGSALPNYLFTEQAAAGVYTTVTDLAQFGAAYMQGPQGELPGRGVLSAESLAEMEAVQSAIPGGSVEGFISGMDGYGLGMYVETLPDGSKTVNHTGGNKGWRSLLLVAPDKRAALVVLTNSDNGGGVADEVRARWADWLGAGTPKGMQHMALLGRWITAVSTLLLAGFAAWLVGLARGMARKERRFNLKPNLRAWSGWRTALLLILALFLAAAWIFLGSLMVGSIFPLQTGLVGAAVLAWIAALGMGAVLEKSGKSQKEE